jgi:response regulator RpfG family c-di-GMP phosphodiesterase
MEKRTPMMSSLMVSNDKRFFSDIESVLAENGIKLDWAGTGTSGLSLLLDKPCDLLIVEENLPDMTIRQFIEKVVTKSPMTQCVVASPLTKKKFHQAYEGFGILMQFPVFPSRKEAQQLLDHMKQLSDLKRKISGEKNDDH